MKKMAFCSSQPKTQLTINSYVGNQQVNKLEAVLSAQKELQYALQMFVHDMSCLKFDCRDVAVMKI